MQQNHPQFVLESHPFHRDQCAPLFVWYRVLHYSGGFLSGFSSVDFYPCGRSRAAKPLAPSFAASRSEEESRLRIAVIPNPTLVSRQTSTGENMMCCC